MSNPKEDKKLQELLKSISDGAEKNFNMEHFYNTVIFPKVQEIYHLCEANDIPFVAAFVYQKTDEGISVAASNVTGSEAHKCVPMQFITHLIRDQKALHKAMTLHALVNVFDLPDTEQTQPTNPEGKKNEPNS